MSSPIAAELVGRFSIPALLLDEHGVIVSVNAAMADVIGHPPASLLGARLEAFVSDTTGLDAIVGDGAGISAELRFVASDGTERCLALSVAARFPERLVTAFDLTEQRANEWKLQNDCNRYLDMATAGSDSLHEIELGPDENRGEVRVISLKRVKGKLSFREHVRVWPGEIIDTAYESENLERYFAAIRAREPYQNVTWRALRRDNREQYIRTSAVPYKGADGSVLGYRGIGIDVTEQVLAERALKNSREMLALSEQHQATAQRVAGVGSAECDLRTKALKWSDGLFRLYRVDPATFEASPENILRLIHPADRKRIVKYFEQFLAGEMPPPGEYRVVRADGTVGIHFYEAEIVPDELGAPVRAIAIVKDITELRERISDLEDAREQLLEQGADLEMAAEALARARDAAEEASHAKSAFLANMSHELRTPLNAILGFSEMIAGGYCGEISERYSGYGADIHASGEHLLELINQILDLSKIEAGRMELQESMFSPADVFADCRRLLHERAAKAEVMLEADVAPGLPVICADALKFKQILLNLVSNAIKFTPPGGHVCLTARGCAEGLAVIVRDTGIGMRPEDIPLALEPFRQVGDDKRHKQQGTGLGLPLAKAFVELHGGKFEIVSRLQGGTTVTVTFPADRIVSPARADRSA